ncbi:MAG: DegV family protein [Anaerolineaceae bacterium]|jgi:DegV family protein with EDD domain
MIKILTDSCADLNQDLISRFDIHTISLTVFINGKIYHDGVDISLPELYRQIDTSRELPKTSAPSVAEFQTFFQSIPGNLIYIGIGSKLSATFQNAFLASNTLPERKIHILDSRNLSTGIGLLVLRAADLRDQGMAADEIDREIQTLLPKVHTSFVVDTLEYLYKGGRCSAVENIVGSLLKIRPVIEVKPDGSLDIKEKTRGTRKKALTYLLDDFKAHLPNIDLHRVFVTHTGCTDDSNFLAEELRNMAAIEEIYITTAGCTISSHCGPGTIGILFLEK